MYFQNRNSYIRSHNKCVASERTPHAFSHITGDKTRLAFIFHKYCVYMLFDHYDTPMIRNLNFLYFTSWIN